MTPSSTHFCPPESWVPDLPRTGSSPTVVGFVIPSHLSLDCFSRVRRASPILPSHLFSASVAPSTSTICSHPSVLFHARPLSCISGPCCPSLPVCTSGPFTPIGNFMLRRCSHHRTPKTWGPFAPVVEDLPPWLTTNLHG